MLSLIRTIGVFGEFVFLCGLIMVFVARYRGTQPPLQFFVKHRNLAGIFCVFTCIGFVYFMIQIIIK